MILVKLEIAKGCQVYFILRIVCSKLCFIFVFLDIQKQIQHQSRTHSRSSSEGPRLKANDPGENDLMLKTDNSRTDSPDNDSAFSDTVSMLSSESSASSGGSTGPKFQILNFGQSTQVFFLFDSRLSVWSFNKTFRCFRTKLVV